MNTTNASTTYRGDSEMNEQQKNQLHGKRMGWLCRILACVSICAIIAAIYLGYFSSHVGYDGELRDGLNRLLDDVPGGLSIILRQWAGYIWFFIDCVVLFTLVLLADRLFTKSKTYFTGIRRVDY